MLGEQLAEKVPQAPRHGELPRLTGRHVGPELDRDDQGVDPGRVHRRGEVGSGTRGTRVGARFVVGRDRRRDAALPPVEIDHQPGSARRIEAGRDVNGDVGARRTRECARPQLVEERLRQRRRARPRTRYPARSRRPSRCARGVRNERRIEGGDRSDPESDQQARSLDHGDVGPAGMSVADASTQFRGRVDGSASEGYSNRESRFQSSRNLPGRSRVGASGRRIASPREAGCRSRRACGVAFLRGGDPCK